MMTSSNGSLVRVTGHLCGEFTGHRWICRKKASDTELWCFLWSALNKRLSKQWWGWWIETPSCPLWRHCNELDITHGQHQTNVLTRVLVKSQNYNIGRFKYCIAMTCDQYLGWDGDCKNPGRSDNSTSKPYGSPIADLITCLRYCQIHISILHHLVQILAPLLHFNRVRYR